MNAEDRKRVEEMRRCVYACADLANEQRNQLLAILDRVDPVGAPIYGCSRMEQEIENVKAENARLAARLDAMIAQSPAPLGPNGPPERIVVSAEADKAYCDACGGGLYQDDEFVRSRARGLRAAFKVMLAENLPQHERRLSQHGLGAERVYRTVTGEEWPG